MVLDWWTLPYHGFNFPNLDFEPDRRTDDYDQQRGREQVIHDHYSPPLNKVRPINPKNKNYKKYMDAAKKVEKQ